MMVRLQRKSEDAAKYAHEMFQFHDGTITTAAVKRVQALRAKFQFHDGTITTWFSFL